MRTSTRISLTYKFLACVSLSLTSLLAYIIWSYQPVPDTLGEALQPFGIGASLLAGITQAYLTVADPLARRVVRMLRYKSL